MEFGEWAAIFTLLHPRLHGERFRPMGGRLPHTGLQPWAASGGEAWPARRKIAVWYRVRTER